MHRVYNSAFMHMLRDEDNAGYRRVIKETLEFDPEILKRYVNFMNNPDEKTAVEQFGKGDKYFGVATLMATLPGLPMFGPRPVRGVRREVRHGVPAGVLDEQPDQWLIDAPRARDRARCSTGGATSPRRATSCCTTSCADGGGVDEHVFAYSNGPAPSRSLVVYHNRYAETSGWIRDSAAYAVKDGRRVEAAGAADAGGGPRAAPTDRRTTAGSRSASSGPALEYLRSVARDPRARPARRAARVRDRVFWEMRELVDSAGVWGRLAERLGGRGVPSLEGALRELELTPVHDALRAVIAEPARPTVERLVAAVAEATGTDGRPGGRRRPSRARGAR